MADTLPTTNYYKNLGGINQKSSKYEMSTAQFLDLRNLDFDIPNSLQKRPGSTFAVTAGTTGPISSLFEFVKLTGQSYIIAGSDTAMFYLQSNAYTLLDPGWNNGQPTDMLTFVNKLWMANGQNWKQWDGLSGSASVAPVGLPVPPAAIGVTVNGQSFVLSNYAQIQNFVLPNASFMLVGGATHIHQGASWISRGVFVAYSYVRNDGYYGPVDFINTARNIVTQKSVANTEEFFAPSSNATLITFIDGFTAPASYGISAIALWVAVDTVSIGSNLIGMPNGAQARGGNLGFVSDSSLNGIHFLGLTLNPNPDLSRFHLFTLIPVGSLFLVDVGTSYPLFYGATFGITSFSALDNVAGPGIGWSGMQNNFFASFIPKYLDVNQNVMFASGFSGAPSSVLFSDLGQPEVYQPENTFEVRTNDGDRIYGQKAFNNQMIFMKEHSFSKLIGDNADNFQLIELSTDFGCLSNATILTKDQTLFWLDRKGILEYNGANWQIASGPIEGIFRRMNLSAAKEKAVGVHHMYRNQLWWGIPVDGATQNNITVVYDYLIGGWTFFDGYTTSSYTYAKGALSRPTVWRGDYSGIIHYTGESFYSDSGRGITCLALTRYENVGGEQQTTLWRRFFLDVAPAVGLTGPISGQVYANYDSSTVQATFMMFQSQFQSRAEMGIVGKAVAAQFSHSSASLPLLINGYSWANRGLRNV